MSNQNQQTKQKSKLDGLNTMKTATLQVYHLIGIHDAVACRVMYRGRVLWSILENNSQNAVVDKCIEWAKSNGFTHFKTIYR